MSTLTPITLTTVTKTISNQNNKHPSTVALRNKFSPTVTKYINSFLTHYEVAELSKTSPYFRELCSKDLAERKKVIELLFHVFNADPKKVEEFFEQTTVYHKMILFKSSFRECYHSNKLNASVCLRRWGSVSSLQAAALSGDNFLVLKLLKYLITNDNYLSEARKQLQEVITRKKITLNPTTTIQTNTHSDYSLLSLIFTPLLWLNGGSKQETKVNAENTKIEFSDLSEYLAPLKNLLKSYDHFITQFYKLVGKNKWEEITKLWAEVGEFQKKLPIYFLQEFFNEIPFDPIPKFDTEPTRGKCCFWDHGNWEYRLLELDNLGIGQQFPGYNRGLGKKDRRYVSLQPCCGLWWMDTPRLDSLALTHLLEVRQSQLEEIIESLRSAETTHTLFHAYKSTSNYRVFKKIDAINVSTSTLKVTNL